jgi:hypothetical protein
VTRTRGFPDKFQEIDQTMSKDAEIRPFPVHRIFSLNPETQFLAGRETALRRAGEILFFRSAG